MRIKLLDWDNLMSMAMPPDPRVPNVKTTVSGCLIYGEECMNMSIPPSWKETRCGKSVEVEPQTGRDGVFSVMVDGKVTGESIHGRWVDHSPIEGDDSIEGETPWAWYDRWEGRLRGREGVVEPK